MINPETIVDTFTIDSYKSLTLDQRDVENFIVEAAIKKSIIPVSLRYGLFKNVYRGVIQDHQGQHFYFNLPQDQEIHIVKADTPTKEWEANKLYKNCILGCDLLKSSPKDEEEEPEDDKLKKEVTNLPPASSLEEEEIRTQDSQITRDHPGATTAQTPQSPGATERWHGPQPTVKSIPDEEPPQTATTWNTAQLMKAWGDQLQQATAHVNYVDPKLKQFLTQELGRDQREVDAGRARLTPSQKIQYNMWLTKSLQNRLGTLSNWRKKR